MLGMRRFIQLTQLKNDEGLRREGMGRQMISLKISTESGLSASDEQYFINLARSFDARRTTVERSPTEITFVIDFDDVTKAAKLRTILEA
jgi:hypothetical protein